MCKKKADKFKRPVQAFIMFANQEGFERCSEYVSTEKNVLGFPVWNESDYALTILDEKLEVIESPEPSDLIWENLSNN